MKANWFLEEQIEEEQTSFDAYLEELGQPIDLSDPGTLNAELIALVNDESALHAAGVTCAVKDNADSSCTACPIKEVDPNKALSALCRCGVAQERSATLLAIHRHRPDATQG